MPSLSRGKLTTGVATFAAAIALVGAGVFAGANFASAAPCSARVLVDGVEAKPVVGTDFAFDSTGDDWESQSMERIQLVGGGATRQVKVQVAMVAGASLRLDDWTLTIWEVDRF